MICQNCGREFDGFFCPACGTKAGEAAAPEVNAQEAPNAAAQEAAAQAAPQSAPQQPTPNGSGYTAQQQGYAQAPVQKANGMAIASMICGIIALPLMLTVFGGLILGIIAIVLAVASRKNGVNGMAVAGLVTGIIAVILTGIILALFGSALACAGSLASCYY